MPFAQEDVAGKLLADSDRYVWLLQDKLGTVRDVLNRSGGIVARVEYNPFGVIQSVTNAAGQTIALPTRWLYTCQEYDPITGNIWFSNGTGRGRWYNPTLNRFLQPDELGFAAGDMNLYRPVGNSPTNASDPSGQGPVGPGFPGTPGSFPPNVPGPGPKVQGPPLPPAPLPKPEPPAAPRIRGLDEIIADERDTGIGPTEKELDYWRDHRISEYRRYYRTMKPGDDYYYDSKSRSWVYWENPCTISPVLTPEERQQRHLSKLYEEGGFGAMVFGQGGSLDQFTGVMGGFACQFPGESGTGPVAKEKGVRVPRGHSKNSDSKPAGAPKGSNNPKTSAAAGAGSRAHADQPGRLPDQLRERYPETQFKFAKPGEVGQDVTVIGGKHPSEYPGSTWPKGVNHGDFKPNSATGDRTFRSDQRNKWPDPTHKLPYDRSSGTLL